MIGYSARVGKIVQRGLGVSLLFAGLGLGGGCADIVGIQKRAGGDQVYDTVQKDKLTTPECIEYCDVVMEACKAEDAVYTTRVTCLDVCNSLDPGDEAEPEGNTVACRKRQATIALQTEAPAEFCPSAGPASGETCGNDCDSWCTLLEAACPDDFGALADCKKSCAALADAGPFNIDDYYTGDSLQCRLIHVSAALADPSHCAHAAFVATDKCIDEEAVDAPSCDVYCRNVMAACTGADAQYESMEQCRGSCAAFPVGDIEDTTGNTLGCRQYHAEAALAQAVPHCPHAGPTGAGMCEDSAHPGACDAYCLMRQAGCEGEGRDVCRTACQTAFAGDGADDMDPYTVAKAEDADGLSCRILYLSRALGGDAAACDHAGALEPCPE